MYVLFPCLGAWIDGLVTTIQKIQLPASFCPYQTSSIDPQEMAPVLDPALPATAAPTTNWD